MWKPKHQKRKERNQIVGLACFVLVGLPALAVLAHVVGLVIANAR